MGCLAYACLCGYVEKLKKISRLPDIGFVYLKRAKGVRCIYQIVDEYMMIYVSFIGFPTVIGNMI